MTNSPPNKQFEGQTGFPTPNAPPEDSGCRVFIIPSDEEWFALFMAAALQLTHEYNWFKNGDLTAAEAASSWSDIIEAAYQRALLGTCLIDVPAPYWDLDSADDADDEMPVETQIWYGQIVALPEMALLPSDDLTFLDNLGIWLIAGFIAYSGQVGAAIAFVPLAKKFVLAFKQHSLGGVVSVLVDFLHLADIDTYGVEDGVINTTVSIPDDGESHTLYVMMSDESNPAAGDTPNIQVIRKRLDETEVTPENLRYDVDCDCVQQTPDNGTTWVDSPTQDPRTSTLFQVPPRGGDDPRCDSAQQMHDRLKHMLDAIIASSDILQAINSVIGIIAVFFLDFGIVIEAIWAIISAIFSIGTTTLDAALTDAVYDELLCLIYCNLLPDGTMTQARFDRVENQVNDRIGGVAAFAITNMMDSLGFVGMNNAGALGEVTGDCSGCECDWCFTFFFVDGFNDFVPLTNEFGTYGTTSAGGIKSAFFAAPAFSNLQQVNMTRDFGGLAVTSVEVVTNDPDWNGTPSTFYLNNDGTNFFAEDMIPDFQTHSYSSTITLNNLTIGTVQSNQGSTQFNYVVSLTLRGIGDNPFGDNNC